MGIGRWCHTLNKKKQYTIVAEGQFNKSGYRDGICREVYETGYVYEGHWDEGVQIPPPDKERGGKLHTGPKEEDKN